VINKKYLNSSVVSIPITEVDAIYCCRTVISKEWINSIVEKIKNNQIEKKEIAHQLACGCPQFDPIVKAWKEKNE